MDPMCSGLECPHHTLSKCRPHPLPWGGVQPSKSVGATSLFPPSRQQGGSPGWSSQQLCAHRRLEPPRVCPEGPQWCPQLSAPHHQRPITRKAGRGGCYGTLSVNLSCKQFLLGKDWFFICVCYVHVEVGFAGSEVVALTQGRHTDTMHKFPSACLAAWARP